MNNFVLVRRTWGNATEFNEVVPALTANSNNVVTIDPPRHGRNVTPISEVTMEAYFQKVISVIKLQDSKDVLVRHSLAAVVIYQVAEVIPKKLIYLAAILPKSGDTALGLMQNDENDVLLKKTQFSDDKSYATISTDDAWHIFSLDMNDKERLEKLIPDYLIKQATQPFLPSTEVSLENLGSIPKYYIRASLDQALSPSLQDQIISNWRLEQVFTLESGQVASLSPLLLKSFPL